MLHDDEIMAQVLAVFQEEQVEHRQAISEIVLELERNPEHPQRSGMLDQLFREAHSLKGGARAAGLTAVEQLAHWMEDLFSAVRQGNVQLTPAVCDPIYITLDVIGNLMNQVAAGQEIQFAPFELLIKLSQQYRAQQGQGAERPGGDGRNGANGHVASLDERAAQPEPGLLAGSATELGSATVRLSTALLDSLLNETGELTTCNLRTRQRAREAQGLVERTAKWRRSWRKVRSVYKKAHERTSAFQPTIHYLSDRENLPMPAAQAAANDRETDVLLGALTQANDLIRELELALANHTRALSDDSIRLGMVTDRLQDQVRRTRMLPLAPLFNQIKIQTREMLRQLNKRINLQLDDGGAEADRQVLERLREVLLHLLRNAFDHGIEEEETRLLAGKPAEGRVSLLAQVNGDRLVITLTDDGSGLDFAAIKQRAIGLGMLNQTDLTRMDEASLKDLIFTPGFSTRETVSKISGRGVGLDIVRSQVERMQGRVEVQSVAGQGVTFIVSVPLSLTTSHGLLLRAAGETYAIPLDSVQRIIAVTPNNVHTVEGRAALTLNSRPVVMISLADLLGRKAKTAPARHEGTPTALILGSGERQIACLIDAVIGEQGLVVQRLPAPLQQVRCIGGATILADGRVIPVLDPVDLLKAAIGVRSVARPVVEPQTKQRAPLVLVVDDSITTRTLERNILEAAGYRVRLATDGVEALQLLRQAGDSEQFNLILSDIDMPRLNGFELTSQVRGDPGIKHLPIVLITSLDNPHDRERGIAAGADAYIVKRSFDQRALLDTIAQLL